MTAVQSQIWNAHNYENQNVWTDRGTDRQQTVIIFFRVLMNALH